MRVHSLAAMSLFAGSALAACSKPAPPTLVPDSVTITGVDLQAVHFDLRLTATNPNGKDLSVRDLTAKVVVGGAVDMGTVTVPAVTTLPAGQATPLDVPLVMKWSDIGALAQLAASGPAVPFTLDGTVNLGGDLLSIAVPFHMVGSLEHDQLVSAALHSMPTFGIPGLAAPPAH